MADVSWGSLGFSPCLLRFVVAGWLPPCKRWMGLTGQSAGSLGEMPGPSRPFGPCQVKDVPAAAAQIRPGVWIEDDKGLCLRHGKD
jgi:hypothetical protein